MDYVDGSDVIAEVFVRKRKGIRETEGDVVTGAERDQEMLCDWP